MNKLMKNLDIKTISLDFWDTIFIYSFTEDLLVKRTNINYEILKKYSINFDSVDYEIRDIYNYFDKIWITKHRTPSTPEMINRIVENLKIEKINKSDFEQLVMENEDLVLNNNLKVIDDAVRVIKKLASKYNLAVISDTGFEPGNKLRKVLENHDIRDLFSCEVFSNETGFSKPDKRAFDIVASKTNTIPSEIVHIGDREHTDIIGGKSAGFKTILFSGIRDCDFNTTTADYKVKSWVEIENLLL